MRLIQVNPAEPAIPLLLAQPACSCGHGLGAWPLLFEERRTRRGIDETVVVDVESPGQAKSRVERERADEGAGPESRGLQLGRECFVGPRQPEAGVIADAVVDWEPSGHDARV